MTVPKYTVMAQQAFSLAELFKASFPKRVGGVKLYRVELDAPDGPSTGGGKQAGQHVALVPDGDGPSLVVGAANPASKTAEVRSYAYLCAQHAQRFKGASFPIDAAQYADLQQRLRQFFKGQGFGVRTLEASEQDRAAAAAAARPSQGSSAMILAVAAVAGLALAAIAWWFLVR